MKKLKLVTSFIAILMAFAVLSSCEEEGTNPTLSDNELIAAIQSASDKSSINVNELPGSATSVVASDFSESFIASAELAASLGFQVTLVRERGSRIGESESAFFDVTGRALVSDTTRRGQRDGRGRKKRGQQQRDCFEFVFPISLTVTDGTTFNLAVKEDFSQIKEWYKANPDQRERPEFTFPLDITFGGEVTTINNTEELREARGACQEDRSKGRCFAMVYPITMVMPDASEIILTSGADRRLIRKWYNDNPDAEDKPTVVFPIQITKEDGTTVTINSEAELTAAKEGC
ncbi:MAG: hypothetical protein ACJAXX_002632 [Roseivirga sp.]|jgi:hypothetical protein